MLPSAVSRFAAPNRSTARAVLGTFNGRVGGRNRQDDFTLDVTRRGIFSASLTGLQANAALQLRSSNGRVIASSNRPGRRAEFIQRTLDPGQYSVRVLRNGSRTPYTLMISDDSGSPANPSPPAPPANPVQNLFGTYQGIGTTTIGTIDPLSRQITSTNSFQTRIIGSVAASRSAGGVTETNPFSLSVNSSPAEIAANAQGAIQLNSALPFNFRGGFLLQYWNLQYSGNQLSGTLVNPGTAEALATNLFNSTQNLGLGLTIPFPYVMSTGTRLQGTLTSTELRLRIEGVDTGQTRIFVTELVAQRTA